jgi:predicted aldo/keto reductase-like oxidoreductase
MNNGDKISVIGFGAMRFPEKGGFIDEELSEKLILHAYEKGINYFDTAWPYHNMASEPFVGKVIEKNNLRKKINLATKLPTWMVNETADMNSLFEKKLERLRTDYVDYYLIHSLDGGSWEKMNGLGVGAFLDNLTEEKKIRQAGFSFHGRAQDFEGILRGYKWDFVQIQYNILDADFQAGIKGLELANELGIKVIVMEPLRGGALAGRTPEKIQKIMDSSETKREPVDWMLSYIWNHPGVTTILSGMNALSQIDQNTEIAEKATAGSLSESEIKTLEEIKVAYRGLFPIACTGCNYCTPCPHGVSIPGCFSFYNTKHAFNDSKGATEQYAMWIGGAIGSPPSIASLCTECGECEPKCPQNIEIIKDLKRVAKEFDGMKLTWNVWQQKKKLKKSGKKGRKQVEKLRD